MIVALMNVTTYTAYMLALHDVSWVEQQDNALTALHACTIGVHAQHACRMQTDASILDFCLSLKGCVDKSNSPVLQGISERRAKAAATIEAQGQVGSLIKGENKAYPMSL